MIKKIVLMLVVMLSHPAVSFAAEISASIGGTIRGGGTHGHYIYVAQRDSVIVLDASDKQHVHCLGKLSKPEYRIESAELRWPVFFCSYRRVGSFYTGLGCVDVTSPTNPHEVKAIKSDFWKHFDFITSGSLLLMEGNTFRAYDIKNPLNPVMLDPDKFDYKIFENLVKTKNASKTQFARPPGALYIGNVHNVRVIGNVAYVIDDDPGLKMIDVSDPANPRYLGLAKDNIKIGSQMKPKALIEKSCIRYGKYTIQIKRIDEMENDPQYDHSIVIEDDSNPEKPKTVATVRKWFGSGKGTDCVFESWVSDDCLILVRTRANTGGNYPYLEIYSLKDPTKPALAGTIANIDYPPEQVVVCGNFAYIAHGEDGLSIRNIVPGELPWDD